MDERTLMIVDDEPLNLHAMGKILNRQGYRLALFTDPEKALEHLQKFPGVDLILLDLQMPEINGCEFYRRLRARPETASIPVLFMTAHDRATAEAMCGLEEMAMLQKPVEVDTLTRLLAEHFGK